MVDEQLAIALSQRAQVRLTAGLCACVIDASVVSRRSMILAATCRSDLEAILVAGALPRFLLAQCVEVAVLCPGDHCMLCIEISNNQAERLRMRAMRELRLRHDIVLVFRGEHAGLRSE